LKQFQNSIEKYHTVGTVPKLNRKIVERGKMDTLNTFLLCMKTGAFNNI
jgi:hypothetical protein